MVFGPNVPNTFSNLPPMPRFNASTVISVTPTITSGSSYASGNQLGGIMHLPYALRQGGQMGYGITELVNVTILDASKQDAAIDIWMFNQSPTVTSSDHAAFAMTGANQALQCVGSASLGVSGTSGAYSDAAAVSVSTNSNINLVMLVPASVANPADLYAIAIVRGTPTYTSTTALQFKFSFFMD